MSIVRCQCSHLIDEDSKEVSALFLTPAARQELARRVGDAASVSGPHGFDTAGLEELMERLFEGLSVDALLCPECGRLLLADPDDPERFVSFVEEPVED